MLSFHFLNICCDFKKKKKNQIAMHRARGSFHAGAQNVWMNWPGSLEELVRTALEIDKTGVQSIKIARTWTCA